MRLFVAVELPDDVVALVGERVARPASGSLRWTTPEQWHVTVRFLGEVAAAAPVADALDAVVTGISGVVARLGPATAWFPGRRVLQVPVDGLDGLAEAVGGATADLGASPSDPFRGHLTLARVRGRARGPAALAGTPLAASWPVRELVLFRSTTAPDGARYEALHRAGLS